MLTAAHEGISCLSSRTCLNPVSNDDHGQCKEARRAPRAKYSILDSSNARSSNESPLASITNNQMLISSRCVKFQADMDEASASSMAKPPEFWAVLAARLKQLQARSSKNDASERILGLIDEHEALEQCDHPASLLAMASIVAKFVDDLSDSRKKQLVTALISLACFLVESSTLNENSKIRRCLRLVLALDVDGKFALSILDENMALMNSNLVDCNEGVASATAILLEEIGLQSSLHAVGPWALLFGSTFQEVSTVSDAFHIFTEPMEHAQKPSEECSAVVATINSTGCAQTSN